LAEKGLGEARQVLELLGNTLKRHELVSDEGLAVLDIVNSYARTWQLLWQYNENSLPAFLSCRTALFHRNPIRCLHRREGRN
jgi:hypothetical protein